MKYSVGCGFFGIYAGVLKPNGTEWKDKTNVTLDVLSCATQYLLENNKEFHAGYDDKAYVLKVVEEE